MNVIGVSLRTDNAFQSKSLAIFQLTEPYNDLNKNEQWDKGEDYNDKNLNGLYDKGSSFKSYVTLLTETDFLMWVLNSLLVSFVVTFTGVVLASTSDYAL